MNIILSSKNKYFLWSKIYESKKEYGYKQGLSVNIKHLVVLVLFLKVYLNS